MGVIGPNRVAVVAGNGPSLAGIAPGRVTAADAVLRTNSFFLEPEYFLGTRVDLALVAGDPRVAPFIAETIRRRADLYDVRHWAAVKPRVAQSVRARLRHLPEVAMTYADAATAAEVARLAAEYQAEPTAGVQLMLLAHALGAREILLAGIDLYATPQRYAFDPGPRMWRLMGRDFGTRSWDSHLHHPDLDRRLIAWLAARDGVRVLRAADLSPLADLIDLAPVREGPAPARPPKPPVEDWAGWAGWYPIWALWALRQGRALQRRLTGSSGRS